VTINNIQTNAQCEILRSYSLSIELPIDLLNINLRFYIKINTQLYTVDAFLLRCNECRAVSRESCLSVRLSVKRADCDKTEESSDPDFCTI